MICVMNDFDFERKSDPSAATPADLLFLGMENPHEGARVSDGGYGGAFHELRVSSEVDRAEKLPDLESRFYGNVEQGGSRSLDEEERMDIDDGEEDMASPAEDNMVSFVDPSICMHGFRIGDMVWGKVKSHPWWPGHIFNEAFASTSVRRTKREGHVLVAFFGDSSYGWFDPAELIPFEPHFTEKSRQTTSRTFVRAVEEAVDEASRRGALAVACRCRNLHNFRPTSFTGYFAVDVVGYERGGIYSSKQIKKARDSFIPVELVSFVQQLALSPHDRDGNNIEWIQSKAKLLSYRKAVFEEFDETYAQAFGVQPVRPPPNSAGVLDQPDRFTPRVAPLSGPLRVAEALGERRSSTKHASDKIPGKIAKKNKYLLKRRDDLPAATAAISSLPDLPSAPPPRHHGFFPSPDSNDLPVSGMDSNYVLQKRENLPPSPPAVALEPYEDWKSRAETLLPPVYLAKPEQVGVKNERVSSEIMVLMPSTHAKVLKADDSMAVAKKEKPLKRPREDLHNRGEVKKKKKKKKYDLGSDQAVAFIDGVHHRTAARRLAGTCVASPELVPQDDTINIELGRGLDLTSLELPHLLDDLSSIALDPFYAIERDAPSIIRHVFLRFRSLVYQKSLVLPAASELAAPIQASSAVIAPLSREGMEPSAVKEGRDRREPSSLSSKPPKPSSKSSDPSKAVRKHGPSNRQEELMAKKIKKMDKLKALAREKKAAINQKNYEIQQQQQKDQKDVATMTGAESTKKQEPPPPQPKVASPTYLVMKFPPRSTLPSIANLKARFARFGPLDQSATRVYWKSYSCKVLFKYKADAQLAYDFVQNNNLFGQFKVDCHLRDLEVVGQEKPADPSKRPFDSSRPENPIQLRPGGASLQSASSFSQAPQNPVQLKSILKKPGSDESGYNGSAAAGGNARDSPRVKFMLNSDDSHNEPLPKAVVSSGNGGSSVGQAPLLSSIDPISRQPPNSVGFFPALPPQPKQNYSLRLEMHPYHILPPPLQQTSLPPPPPLQPHSIDFLGSRGLQLSTLLKEPARDISDDISGPMLSLLLKCNDIVSKMKSSLGYLPYHAM